MPFDRPELAALIERAAGDVESRLAGVDARLRRSNAGVLSRVHAGGAHGLYGAIDWTARQILPDTADPDLLVRHANIHGLTAQAAQSASGSITVTGADGSVVPAGTVFVRADQAEYLSTTDATVSAGTANVPVVARAAGAAGNTAAGAQMTAAAVVTGVDTVAQVASGGIVSGADEEPAERLLARLLDHLRQPPHGGAAHDYVAWALEAGPAVTRAWVYPLEMGPNTVTVRFVTDDSQGGPIPAESVVEEVGAYIESQRPVTVRVFTVAPVPKTLSVNLRITPDTPAVRQAVEAELVDLLRREAEPGSTLLISRIREAISLAAGETDHDLIAPVENVGSEPFELFAAVDLVFS